MYSYDTVTEAVQGLRQRGFEKDFSLQENCIICDEIRYHPEDFEIVEVYRFEGDSDPADEAVVYAIESRKGNKGILVSGYGIYANEITSELAKKLTIHHE